MAKKTVIRRLSKRLPTSNDLGADRDTIDTVVPASVEEMTPPSLQPAITVEDLNHQIAAAQESPNPEPEPASEPDPQAPNSEAPPSSPNLGPSSLTLEATSGPEQPAPATEPGTAERLPQGRTIVTDELQPAPTPAAPATGRRSGPAPVRRSGPAADDPIPGLVD